MKPLDVEFVTGLSGYFVKDLEAVRQSPTYDPLVNNITPRTPGFQQVVQAGQVISILLHLPNGQWAVGDCVDVIFSGAASRDPLFNANEHLPLLESVVKPWLLNCDITHFRPNAIRVDSPWPELQGLRLHSAIRYGLSQALLSATALAHLCPAAGIIAREWGTSIVDRPVDILASCHRDDFLQLDRMIMKQVAMLPHASFIHVHDLGPRGSAMLEFVEKVSRRVQERGAPGYRPRLHFDVYGTMGDLFLDDTELVSFLGELQRVAQPYDLLIESPVIAATKAAQIQQLKNLRLRLREQSIPVQLVADEWCNTLDDIREFADAGAVDFVQIKMPDLGSIHNSIDAVLYCRERKVGCCLGGSANETDVSARITAHVALATQPDFLLSKPGIGADEGVMILTNEMLRTSAVTRKSRLNKI
ncbi:putative methylaspartate ammonia-lyase [Aspergillus ruber CBS 135680]|uniref:methylaspartate ammonia-lyase n=1 Tax=Aspergillus ruber (strain CBS 135680) TaxID=1388766 RepID=A0A017SQS5_ASPRC|nr:putative methylaspartate ammonia-lyase [Aspergillus ruber CBS 135680]EYE99327.1 putative methylaspartate ammonia-lyase [Aspergillus ruber CBS 135680]